MQAEQQARYQSFLEAKCDGYGFRRGTTAYAQCMQSADEAANRNAAEANRIQRERSKEAWDAVCMQDLACRATRK